MQYRFSFWTCQFTITLFHRYQFFLYRIDTIILKAIYYIIVRKSIIIYTYGLHVDVEFVRICFGFVHSANGFAETLVSHIEMRERQQHWRICTETDRLILQNRKKPLKIRLENDQKTVGKRLERR